MGRQSTASRITSLATSGSLWSSAVGNSISRWSGILYVRTRTADLSQESERSTGPRNGIFQRDLVASFSYGGHQMARQTTAEGMAGMLATTATPTVENIDLIIRRSMRRSGHDLRFEA